MRRTLMIATLLGVSMAIGVTGDAGTAGANQLLARRRKPPVSVEVMNFPSGSAPAGESYFSTRIVADGHVGPKLVTTVPPDHFLVITDIDGRYGCGSAECQLIDGSGVRLEWPTDSTTYHRSYTTGIKFGPGERVLWWAESMSIYEKLSGSITFMGKLVASPSGAFLDDDR